MSKVLVTAGTSFIAGHCIKQLLERGYQVVTTVRNDDKGSSVLKAHSNTGKGSLKYTIVKDIAQKGAFDEAVKSIPNLEYVIHTASPFHYNVQDPVKDFLEPAVIGTTSILEAVKAGGPTVKRVVILSSFAAINGGSKETPPMLDESCWNPVTWDEAATDKKKTYQGSKKLAEKAAWDFVEQEGANFELVTVNPVLVFGPVAPHLTVGELGSINTSNSRILDMLQGKMKDKLQPTGFYSNVDVRDVAFAHIRAMELPEAAGKRFFLVAGYHTNKEIAKVIASMGDEYKKLLPDDIDASEDDVPGPNERYRFNNKRSIDVLGVQYTSFEKSIKDTVESLVKLGALEKTA